MQEVEKEVWEKDAGGKRKLRLVQETGYKYEEEMEGELRAYSATYIHHFSVSFHRVFIAATFWLVSVASALRLEMAESCFMRLVTCFRTIQVRTKPAS